jgi:hypothetical protein
MGAHMNDKQVTELSDQEILDSSGGRGVSTERDAGAYIGHEPELAAERIPGGVRSQDQRVAATQSEPAAPGEPEADGSDDGSAVSR